MNESKFQSRENVLNTVFGAALGSCVVLRADPQSVTLSELESGSFFATASRTFASVACLALLATLLITAARRAGSDVAREAPVSPWYVVSFLLLTGLAGIAPSSMANWGKLPSPVRFDGVLFSILCCWFALYLIVGRISR